MNMNVEKMMKLMIVPEEPKKPVWIAQMYVCGNLHRYVYEPYECGANGETNSCGYWFDTMAEAVVWAFVERRLIENWNECAGLIALEEECRHMYEAWLRRERVKAVLPEVPTMIELK